jgi:hypothetical protein
MHAPASVPVVWSKISIADAVPVTVVLAVAAKITLSSARGADRSAARVIVPRCATAAPRDACGTLGITGDWLPGLEMRLAEAVVESPTSSHAEGELSPDFAGSAGHAVSPSGRYD